MKENGAGGAHTKTGLVFEGQTDLATFLSQQNGYRVNPGGDVCFHSECVARIFKKNQLYKTFLKELGIDWQQVISKRLLPDDSIFVAGRKTLYVIECKFQKVEGSVDEKLQTCDFKRKQYRKLLSGAHIEAEYLYLLCDWFRQPRYRDVLDYITSVNCRYFFNSIPLEELGLPLPAPGVI